MSYVTIALVPSSSATRLRDEALARLRQLLPPPLQAISEDDASQFTTAFSGMSFWRYAPIYQLYIRFMMRMYSEPTEENIRIVLDAFDFALLRAGIDQERSPPIWEDLIGYMKGLASHEQLSSSDIWSHCLARSGLPPLASDYTSAMRRVYNAILQTPLNPGFLDRVWGLYAVWEMSLADVPAEKVPELLEDTQSAMVTPELHGPIKLVSAAKMQYEAMAPYAQRRQQRIQQISGANALPRPPCCARVGGIGMTEAGKAALESSRARAKALGSPSDTNMTCGSLEDVTQQLQYWHGAWSNYVSSEICEIEEHSGLSQARQLDSVQSGERDQFWITWCLVDASLACGTDPSLFLRSAEQLGQRSQLDMRLYLVHVLAMLGSQPGSVPVAMRLADTLSQLSEVNAEQIQGALSLVLPDIHTRSGVTLALELLYRWADRERQVDCRAALYIHAIQIIQARNSDALDELIQRVISRGHQHPAITRAAAQCALCGGNYKQTLQTNEEKAVDVIQRMQTGVTSAIQLQRQTSVLHGILRGSGPGKLTTQLQQDLVREESVNGTARADALRHELLGQFSSCVDVTFQGGDHNSKNIRQLAEQIADDENERVQLRYSAPGAPALTPFTLECLGETQSDTPNMINPFRKIGRLAGLRPRDHVAAYSACRIRPFQIDSLKPLLLDPLSDSCETTDVSAALDTEMAPPAAEESVPLPNVLLSAIGMVPVDCGRVILPPDFVKRLASSTIPRPPGLGK